jgi:hypothetical protein
MSKLFGTEEHARIKEAIRYQRSAFSKKTACRGGFETRPYI